MRKMKAESVPELVMMAATLGMRVAVPKLDRPMVGAPL
jgi:hypothetical protein